MIKVKSLFCCLTIAFLLVNFQDGNSQDKNWSNFRGSGMNAIALTDKAPLNWGESEMKWKTEIHDKGMSSPVVYNNQVWVTSARDNGKELYAVCVDFETGKIIYDIKVFTPDSVFKKHEINSYATPTPTIEKGSLYVHYGSLGTACINTTNGSIVWKRNDFKCDYMMGPASSPIIYKNLVILDFEGTDLQFMVALNKLNGELVWKTERPKEIYEPLPSIGKKSYTTPILINVKGRDMLITNASFVCNAYDPATGKEIWRVVRGTESAVAMPFTEKGIVYWYTGFMYAEDQSKFCEILAVNPDGKGDITKSNVLWRKKADYLQLLTPVIRDGLIYTVDPKNNMLCIDASTGEEVWTTHQRANFNASPVFVNGNIWFFSVKGEVLAIKAGRKYEVVARNQMDSGIWATPAFLRNSVILRTEKYLCRIGK
jgi:outer membrane protein assembly factor BamB